MIRIPHLETNVTTSCQNRCVNCNHFVGMEIPKKATFLSPEVMRRDLAIFSKFVHADAYGMLGGEPTLHPKLHVLIDVARESGIADRIEVWTNGQGASEWTKKFWAAPFDLLVLSAYPGKMTDGQIDEVRRACADHGKLFDLKDERTRPNFTRLLKPVAGDAQVTYEQCWFKHFSRVLDNGFFYRCCTSPYIPKLILGRPEGTDGLRVDESLTEFAISEFLGRSEAMESCGPCAGRNTIHAVPVQWSEIRNPVEWLEASAGRRK